MSSTSTVEKSYRIASGKFFELSLNDGSGTEEGRAVMRFDPYLWVNHISPTEVYAPAKFSMTLMSGERETLARAVQAAGMTPEFLTSTATNYSESARLVLADYPSLESALEFVELVVQKTLTTWQESARAKGLEWTWVEKHCSSVQPHDFHSAMLKRSYLDDSYGMWQEQPITLQPEAGMFTGISRPGLSGIDLGDSPNTERMYLYPVIRKSRAVSNDGYNLHMFAVPATHQHSRAPWVEQYVARYETIFRGTMQPTSQRPTNW